MPHPLTPPPIKDRWRELLELNKIIIVETDDGHAYPLPSTQDNKILVALSQNKDISRIKQILTAKLLRQREIKKKIDEKVMERKKIEEMINGIERIDPLGILNEKIEVGRELSPDEDEKEEELQQIERSVRLKVSQLRTKTVSKIILPESSATDDSPIDIRKRESLLLPIMKKESIRNSLKAQSGALVSMMSIPNEEESINRSHSVELNLMNLRLKKSRPSSPSPLPPKWSSPDSPTIPTESSFKRTDSPKSRIVDYSKYKQKVTTGPIHDMLSQRQQIIRPRNPTYHTNVIDFPEFLPAKYKPRCKPAEKTVPNSNSFENSKIAKFSLAAQNRSLSTPKYHPRLHSDINTPLEFMYNQFLRNRQKVASEFQKTFDGKLWVEDLG